MSHDPIEVAAGIVARGGRILIARRKPGSHLAGLWEFPGGKREPRESWEDCLVRELREELDAEVVVGALRLDVTHAYPGRTVRLRFYDCVLVRGEPWAVDCAEVAWVLPGELPGYPFPEADREIVRLLAGA